MDPTYIHCPDCGGTGKLKKTITHFLEQDEYMIIACLRCMGSGIIVENAEELKREQERALERALEYERSARERVERETQKTLKAIELKNAKQEEKKKMEVQQKYIASIPLDLALTVDLLKTGQKKLENLSKRILTELKSLKYSKKPTPEKNKMIQKLEHRLIEIKREIKKREKVHNIKEVHKKLPLNRENRQQTDFTFSDEVIELAQSIKTFEEELSKEIQKLITINNFLIGRRKSQKMAQLREQEEIIRVLKLNIQNLKNELNRRNE